MKVWQQIALWLIGIGLWFSLLGSASSRQKDLEYQHFSLSFENREDRSFLNYAEMEASVQSVLGDSVNRISEINKALLEESIDNHPAIRKAEVYSKIDGSLRIMLWQHNPLARVIQKEGSFYLLENGAQMPLSNHYSERVPLVSGELKEERLKEIADFWLWVKEDEFYKDFFTGLECKEANEWILYPAKGNFKIILGKPIKLKEKLTKLQVFYLRAPRLENINKLKEIDLRFDGQLICRKN
jgi:cell division protein FtsQ